MKRFQFTLLHSAAWLIAVFFVQKNVLLEITKKNEVRIYY